MYAIGDYKHNDSILCLYMSKIKKLVFE